MSPPQRLVTVCASPYFFQCRGLETRVWDGEPQKKAPKTYPELCPFHAENPRNTWICSVLWFLKTRKVAPHYGETSLSKSTKRNMPKCCNCSAAFLDAKSETGDPFLLARTVTIIPKEYDIVKPNVLLNSTQEQQLQQETFLHSFPNVESWNIIVPSRVPARMRCLIVIVPKLRSATAA